jgi:hypothetical protein
VERKVSNEKSLKLAAVQLKKKNLVQATQLAGPLDTSS